MGEAVNWPTNLTSLFWDVEDDMQPINLALSSAHLGNEREHTQQSKTNYY